jgi:hypothetical protein
MIYFNPSATSSILTIVGCTFSNISGSGFNGTGIHMSVGGNIEIVNNIFSEINSSSENAVAGILNLMGTSTSSLKFENNVFLNIISTKSAVLLSGTSNGVNISNCSFSVISSSSSGGVFLLYYIIISLLIY